TQDEGLRTDHYIGTVEMAMNFFRFVAEETREWLAKLGVSTLEELIGRVDLLEILPGATAKQNKLDLRPIIHTDDFLADKPQFCTHKRNSPFDKGELGETMVADILPAIENQSGGEFSYP